MLVEALLVSLLFLVPMTVGVGILATFRIAGPIYRFETYLDQVARGEEVGPCKLRKGDQLQGLCEKINEALAAARDAKDAGEGEGRLERHRRDAA
jgi:nitrogen fixation/metabolism regulation signal transduction histidine kinase